MIPPSPLRLSPLPYPPFPYPPSPFLLWLSPFLTPPPPKKKKKTTGNGCGQNRYDEQLAPSLTALARMSVGAGNREARRGIRSRDAVVRVLGVLRGSLGRDHPDQVPPPPHPTPAERPNLYDRLHQLHPSPSPPRPRPNRHNVSAPHHLTPLFSLPQATPNHIPTPPPTPIISTAPPRLLVKLTTPTCTHQSPPPPPPPKTTTTKQHMLHIQLSPRPPHPIHKSHQPLHPVHQSHHPFQ